MPKKSIWTILVDKGNGSEEITLDELEAALAEIRPKKGAGNT